jgi:hypothetical protein
MASAPRQGFLLVHALELIARVHADLYEGRVREARQRIELTWPDVRASGLLEHQQLRVTLLDLRARAALAAGRDVQDVVVLSRRLEREGVRWAVPIALLLRAGCALRLDDGAGAAWLYAEAAQAADEADLALHAAVARLRKSEISGSDDGAEAWMIGQRVRRPDRLVALLAP